MLSIDGLQPEKGHETLYVVRELRQQRVWFAQALLSSATSEIRPWSCKRVTGPNAWIVPCGCGCRTSKMRS